MEGDQISGTGGVAAPPAGANTDGPPPDATALGAADLTPEQILSARKIWIDGGNDPALFDAAAKQDGYDLNAPPEPDVAAHHAEFGLPVNPQPADYHPLYTAPERITPQDHDEYLGFVAGLGLPPIQGNALLEHLSERGLAWGALKDDTARKLWIAENRAIALRHYGSEEALRSARERVAGLLNEMGGRIGKILADHSVLMTSPYALVTLAGHAEQLAQFAAAHPRDRKSK